MKTEREPKIENAGQGIKTPEENPPGSRAAVALRWFLSKTVREASAMRKHVHRMLCAQRDILSPQAVSSVSAALREMQTAIRSGVAKTDLRKQMDELEEAANKWLKPYPNAQWRENVEVFLVALAVAMGIRTFFVQPFKIPTGSMQPTLFGVTSENLLKQPDFQMPTGLKRVREWFEGVSYIDVKTKASGTLDGITPPVGIRIINFWQKVYIGGVAHTIWFPPDYGQGQLGDQHRAALQLGRRYEKGDQVIRLKVQAGDHLFVDRLTYNFRQPTRGEIIVFQTAGIQPLPQDQFYIKRLVALGGERVQIGDDRHLRINGDRLDSGTKYFENVYSFVPGAPPRDSQYSGHVNQTVADAYRVPGMLAPLFPNENAVQTISPNSYMVMGDNTVNSFDSRGWGEFPASNVIGKSFFVYWPITSRFGWGHR
jgi:signal peptidase I